MVATDSFYQGGIATMEYDLLGMLALAFVLFIGAELWKIQSDNQREVKGLTKSPRSSGSGRSAA